MAASTPPIKDPLLSFIGAGLVVEWLCALFAEPDDEAVRAFLVGEVMRRRGVSEEVARAWVEGREPEAAAQQIAGILQTCARCQGLMSNMTGVYAMRGLWGRGTMIVCPTCRDALVADGWMVVGQQK